MKVDFDSYVRFSSMKLEMGRLVKTTSSIGESNPPPFLSRRGTVTNRRLKSMPPRRRNGIVYGVYPPRFMRAGVLL